MRRKNTLVPFSLFVFVVNAHMLQLYKPCINFSHHPTEHALIWILNWISSCNLCVWSSVQDDSPVVLENKDEKTLFWEQNQWACVSHLHKDCQHQGPAPMPKYSRKGRYLCGKEMCCASGRKPLDYIHMIPTFK